jgi:hypothetical protein
VSDYYALLREFNVPTPDEDIASVSFMDSDYSALRDAAWAAEAAKDNQAQVNQMLSCLLQRHKHDALQCFYL